MPSALFGNSFCFTALYVGAEQMSVYWRNLCRIVVNIITILCKVLYICIYRGYSFNKFTVCVVQIQVPISVSYIGCIDELFRIILYKVNRILWLNISAVRIGEESLNKTSIYGAIYIQIHVLLVAVQYLYVNLVTGRVPGYICKITLFCKVCYIKPYGLFGLSVKYS